MAENNVDSENRKNNKRTPRVKISAQTMATYQLISPFSSIENSSVAKDIISSEEMAKLIPNEDLHKMKNNDICLDIDDGEEDPFSATQIDQSRKLFEKCKRLIDLKKFPSILASRSVNEIKDEMNKITFEESVIQVGKMSKVSNRLNSKQRKEMSNSIKEKLKVKNSITTQNLDNLSFLLPSIDGDDVLPILDNDEKKETYCKNMAKYDLTFSTSNTKYNALYLCLFTVLIR